MLVGNKTKQTLSGKKIVIQSKTGRKNGNSVQTLSGINGYLFQTSGKNGNPIKSFQKMYRVTIFSWLGPREGNRFFLMRFGT